MAIMAIKSSWLVHLNIETENVVTTSYVEAYVLTDHTSIHLYA